MLLLFSTAGDNRAFLHAFLNVDCLHVYMPNTLRLHAYIHYVCLARRMNRLSNRYKRTSYGWSITSLEWSVVGVQIAIDCIQLNFRSFHHRLHWTTHTGFSRGETLPGSARQHLFWLSCFCGSTLKVVCVQQRS